MTSKHLPALSVGALMVLSGLLMMSQATFAQAHDSVFRVQQWSTLIGGAAVMLFGRLARTKPRNAGFAATLGSLAVLMSGVMALPFQPSWSALPGSVLGLAGIFAGLYAMRGTRAGDS